MAPTNHLPKNGEPSSTFSDRGRPVFHRQDYCKVVALVRGSFRNSTLQGIYQRASSPPLYKAASASPPFLCFDSGRLATLVMRSGIIEIKESFFGEQGIRSRPAPIPINFFFERLLH